VEGLLNFFVDAQAALQNIQPKSTDKDVIAVLAEQFVDSITTEQFVIS